MLTFQTVEENAQNGNARLLTERQQRLLLRAVVGSLVLSAALASNATAQQRTAVLGGGPTVQDSPRPVPRIYAAPFRELLAKVRRMAEAGEIKADDYFTFTFEAARDADGQLRDVRVTEQAAANARWRKLTGEFVTLLSDSRALSYLEGVERVTLTVSLGERLTASLAADGPTDEAASRFEKTSALLFDLARHSQRGRAGAEILDGMRASSSGKRFAVNLDMSRAEVGNLLSQASAIP